MSLIVLFFYAFVAIISIVLFILWHRNNYWKRRGIPHDEPRLFLGNMTNATVNRPVFTLVDSIYTKFKGTGPFCGFYFFLNPAVLVLDLDLAKKILIKDFNNFDERGIFHNEKDDPLSAHMFAIDGEKWRPLRQKLTSVFTSGKMKIMFPTIVKVGHRFADTFGEMVMQDSIVELKDILARFTIDVIGTCAFGIDCNSLKDPNAEFSLIGRKIFKDQRHPALIFFFIQSCPNLARKLGMKVTRDDVENCFMRAVRDTVELREKNGIRRNDFIDLMIDIEKQKGTKAEGGEELSGMTLNEIAAQSFVFFQAGFETSSSTMSFALYELARHTEIQDRLRNEVLDVFAKHNGELTYESLTEMHYLDQIISETLRIHCIIPMLVRKAKNNYYTEDPKYYIQKGAAVIIPSMSIQKDPVYYPNPEKFDPERFTPEEIRKRDSVRWLPFGDGPRNCIGLRFGKMQTRIGLALLVKDFRFDICPRTVIPVRYDCKTFILQTEGGIFLRAEKIVQ